jgi:hypothetical protein
MSIIAMPATLVVGAFSIGQKRFDVTEISDSSGASQARLLGPPRWTLSMASPGELSLAQASVWEAMILQLRGQVNFLSAWDIVRTRPRGTLSGSITGTISLGSTSLTLSGQSGTLLQGDWLQVGSGTSGQLFKAVADMSGGVVTVEPPARVAFSGASVSYNPALGHYKLISEVAQWNYQPGSNAVQGFAIDLMEQWT